MKQCYYQLLQIDRKATAAQIKTNYRKLALKFHPDKNPTQQGRQKFLLITEAYEVLSDPNERTWYDNNREKILFNKDQMTKQDVQMYSFGFNIWGYFTSSCFKGYDDDQGGFYWVYRDVFQKIKVEENKAFGMRQDLQEEPRKYQGFGDSKTVLKRVLQFYDDWENFTTYKTFIWVDDYDTRDAPNRYVKREMEKQNKKQRQKEKKTYIKTIKDLVSFLKKRDPRYRDYLLEQKKKEQQRQIQKKQKQEQKKRQKQQMKKVKQELEEQRFKQIEQYYKKQQMNTNANKNHNQSSDEQDVDFYCAICEKEFKSQNQLKNHENSKMHKQNIKLLEKEVMSKQEMVQKAKKEVEVQKQQQPKEEPVKKNKKKNKKKNNQNEQDQKEQQKEEPKVEVKKNDKKAETKAKPEEQQKNPKKQPKKEEKKNQSQESDDDDAFMNALLNKRQTKKAEVVVQQKKPEPKKQAKPTKKVSESENSQSEGEEQQKKKGKAKLKREKKLAKQKDTGLKCNVCAESFTSKTKLFEHLNKTGHAKAK